MYKVTFANNILKQALYPATVSIEELTQRSWHSLSLLVHAVDHLVLLLPAPIPAYTTHSARTASSRRPTSSASSALSTSPLSSLVSSRSSDPRPPVDRSRAARDSARSSHPGFMVKPKRMSRVELYAAVSLRRIRDTLQVSSVGRGTVRESPKWSQMDLLTLSPLRYDQGVW